jgi:hypothetical protein
MRTKRYAPRVKEIKSLIQGALIMCLLIAAVGFVGTIENTYTKEAKVYEVRGNVVTFEDNHGYLWDWEMSEHECYTRGEVVTLVMHTGYTDGTIEDDEIEKIK